MKVFIDAQVNILEKTEKKNQICQVLMQLFIEEGVNTNRMTNQNPTLHSKSNWKPLESYLLIKNSRVTTEQNESWLPCFGGI